MRGVTFSSVGLILGLFSHKLVNAYTNSLDDCAEFAALWSNSCGGTDEDAVYDKDTNWETSGAGVTTSNCSTGDDIQAREPDTADGNFVDSYSVFARNCITCRENVDGEILIRVQTNNMPKHCYGSSDNSSNPHTKKIDFETLWNPDVLGYKNVSNDDVASEAATDSLLCDNSWSSTMASTSIFTDTSSDSIDSFVGLMMDNVMIANALTSDNEDALTEYASDMDFCLSYADSNNFIKYHTMTSCWGSQASTSDVPPLCSQANDDKCVRQPVTFAAKNFTSTDLPYETPIGIAKDGHIIVGPYNEDGELWGCDDHDVCNGVFLSDNSYAYVVTYTFPYVAGCWGPGPS